MSNPPNIAPVGDVAGALKNAVAAAPNARTRVPFVPLHWNDLEKLDVPPVEWLFSRLIPKCGLIAMSGAPGSYKTFYALWMATRLGQGLPLHDNLPLGTMLGQTDGSHRPVPILFLEEENTIGLIKERAMGFKRDVSPEVYFAVESGFTVGNDETREDLLTFAIDRKIKLIIMDPFSSVMGLKDENNNADVAKVMDIIRHTFVKAGISIMFIHHPSKNSEGGNNLRGAGDILGKCDVHISLKKEGKTSKKVTVTYEKMRLMDETLLADFDIELVTSAGPMHFSYLGETRNNAEATLEALKLEILDVFKPGSLLQREDVASALKKTKGDHKFGDAWGALKNDGKIIKTKDGFRKA